MMVENDVAGRVLEAYRTITVVGASGTPGKPAHDIPAFMIENGYEVIPVNPKAPEVLGRRAVPSLKEAPDARFVNVFRPAAEAPRIAQEAVDAGAEVLWLQTGITHPEARRIAEDAGVTYIEDRCVGTEFAVRTRGF